MTTANEFRNLSVGELEEKLGLLKKSLMQYRFQAKTGKLERQNVVAETKRDIARILTVINEQRLNEKPVEGKKS